MTVVGSTEQEVNHEPYLDSSGVLNQSTVLRERMERDGYLFFGSLLPPAALREVYDDIMALCRAYGWADEDNHSVGTPPVEGADLWWDVYDPLQCLEFFHTLAHRTELVDPVKSLVQDEVLVHPRNIARIVPPETQKHTTAPHQDFIYIQGTPTTYSAWFPLMDCALAMGVLGVLEGSHRQGVFPVSKAGGPGGLAVDTQNLDLTWRIGDFSAGDVLLFHSHTVHAATHNQTRNTLRVSVDYRYQAVSAPIVAHGLLPHYDRLDWEQVYEGWEKDELQYYWKKLPLQVTSEQVSIPRQGTEQQS